MARLTFFISLSLALSSIPSGLAGPACARKNFQREDCISLCKARWGWSGTMMGTDPWGSVMKKVDAETWDSVVSTACGTPVVSAATSTADSTLSTSVIQSTESANPTVVVTTASTTSSAVSSITSSAVSSKASSSSKSTPSSVTALGLLASARQSSSTLSSTVRLASTRNPVVQQTATTSAKKVAAAPTSTPVASTGSSGSTSSGDIAAYLAGHNTVRAQHGASPLTWNDNLASKAQQWANTCQFKHSGGSLGPFGENLAAGTGGSYDIPTAIKSWTDEVSRYNPSNPEASHFTQVVWKATTEVGCAVQSCNGIFDASFGPAKYFVCEYSVAGNVGGQFAQNVQA